MKIKPGLYILIQYNDECHCGVSVGIGKVAKVIEACDLPPHKGVWSVRLPKDDSTWELCEGSMKVVDQTQAEFIFRVRNL